MQSVDDLALGNRLAAADDLTIERVFRDSGGALLMGKVLEAHHMAFIHKRFLGIQRQPGFPKHPHHVARDGRGGGQAGGFDARDIEEALLIGFAHEEIIDLRVGAQAREIADGVPEIDIGNRPERHFADKGQSVARGAEIVFFRVLGVRADNQVAVYGGGDEHALAHLARALENNMIDQCALALIEKEIFALVRGDGEGVRSRHVVDFIAPDSGGVDDEAGVNLLAAGRNAEAAVDWLDGSDFTVQLHPRSILHSRFRQRDRQLPRADDSGAGGVKGTGDLGAHIRFHLAHFLGGEHLHAGYAVLCAAIKQLADQRILIGVESKHKAADLLIGNVQLFAQFLDKGVALHVIPGHFGAGMRIVPRMYDGAVGFCGADGNVVLLFHQHGAELVAAQLVEQRAAANAASNDDYVNHSLSSCSRTGKAA